MTTPFQLQGMTAVSRRRRMMYGVTSSATANRYAASGTDPGALTGLGANSLWGVGIAFRLDSLSATARTLAAKSDNVTGWQSYISTAHGLTFYVNNGAGQWVATTLKTLTAADVGKVHCQMVFCLSDSTGGYIQHYFDRVLIGQPTCLGIRTYSGVGTLCSLPNGTAPCTGISVMGKWTFRGSPSEAQVFGWYDALKLRGGVPTTFPGVTLVERYDVRDSVNASGAAPVVVDSQSVAAAQQYAAVGAPTLNNYLSDQQVWGW